MLDQPRNGVTNLLPPRKCHAPFVNVIQRNIRAFFFGSWECVKGAAPQWNGLQMGLHCCPKIKASLILVEKTQMLPRAKYLTNTMLNPSETTLSYDYHMTPPSFFTLPSSKSNYHTYFDYESDYLKHLMVYFSDAGSASGHFVLL